MSYRMRDRAVLAREVENRRAAAEAWGTDAEEGSLFGFFCGMVLILSAAALGLSWAIPAIKGIL
jgi:hypothetical protein